MTTIEKQNKLAKKILQTNDNSILDLIDEILNKTEIVGYHHDGNPIFKNEFISELKAQIESIKNGTAKLYTTIEVRKKITDAYDLGS